MLDWTEYEEQIQAFKRDYIYKTIIETEIKELSYPIIFINVVHFFPFLPPLLSPSHLISPQWGTKVGGGGGGGGGGGEEYIGSIGPSFSTCK